MRGHGKYLQQRFVTSIQLMLEYDNRARRHNVVAADFHATVDEHRAAAPRPSTAVEHVVVRVNVPLFFRMIDEFVLY